METSSRNSEMAMLAVTQHDLELAEIKMEKSRKICQQAEDAYKAANDLSAILNNNGPVKEAKLMQGALKKIGQVLERRRDALSAAADSYLGIEKHLCNLASIIILEIGKNSYNLVDKKINVES